MTRRWRTRLSRLTLGIGLIAVSVLALVASFAVGTWGLQFLSIFPLVAGITDLYATVTNQELRKHPISFVTGALGIAAGALLLISPSLAVNAVAVLILGFLALDGVMRIGQAIFGVTSNTPRMVSAVNGASSLFLVLVGWWIWDIVGAGTAIGVAIAGYTAAAGWRLLASPGSGYEAFDRLEVTNIHPDPQLGLGEHELFDTISAQQSKSSRELWRSETYWLLVIGLVLFVTHVGRMQSTETWLGLISPFVALAGDIILAIALGIFIVLPLRLVWRRLTRLVERKAWQFRLSGDDAHIEALPRRLIQAWTEARFAFSASLRSARSSLPAAGALALRLGLPLAVLFAAINPIWGFSWYFNTESWASGFYQKITELRVDDWRASMVDAVKSAYGDASNRLFQITPAGVNDGDFSFIVIGDPGEGDGSQYSLVENYLMLGRREDIKFLIISSDVIYPAGEMSNYEQNFYLPFKGFSKPIYALPGNHDWFDALEGFNANFLEPKAARAALAARAKADLNITSTDKSRIDELLQSAQRLRELYATQIARQRAPFFELQTTDFSLIVIDTGIRRTIDDRQLAWIKGALKRSEGKFTMAIIGHPKYAGGQDTSKNDKDFLALYNLLEEAGVRVMMAGDTHAFEYYLEEPDKDRNQRGIPHFVNGGGGAYLSIGGSLAWPEKTPMKEWAFYPRAEAVYAKLDAETPSWKQPFWWWIKHFGAWPLSVETLSAMFDFNYAPFYQSFMEVRVERSKNRVVFALYGVNGPLRWKDLDMSHDSRLNAVSDEPVEFIMEMTTPKS